MFQIGHQFVLEKPNSKGKSAITFKFNIKGKRFVYGTGQLIHPELWDKEAQRPTINKKVIDLNQKEDPQIRYLLLNINQRLENIISGTKTFFSLKEQEDATIEFKDLRAYLDRKFKPITSKHKATSQPAPERLEAPRIIDLINFFVRSMSNGTKTIQMPLKKRGHKYDEETIKAYISFKKMFSEFESYHGKEYKITDISKDFEEDLHEFFNDEKEYTPKTKGKHIKMLKVIVHDFLESESHIQYENQKIEKETVLTLNDLYHIEKEIKRILKPDHEPCKIALDENELERLFEMDLSLIPHYDKARDIFLTGCYTALRHSDYSRIGPEHIKGMWIEIIMDKTKKKVRIPIRPELRSILDKWENRIPKMTSQELGRYIKEIGKMAGFNEHIELKESKGGQIIDNVKYKYELITTHTARRSAATIMYYSGMAAKDIMAITGHTKIETFEKYIIKDDKAKDLRLQSSPFFKGKLLLKVVS